MKTELCITLRWLELKNSISASLIPLLFHSMFYITSKSQPGLNYKDLEKVSGQKSVHMTPPGGARHRHESEMSKEEKRGILRTKTKGGVTFQNS